VLTGVALATTNLTLNNFITFLLCFLMGLVIGSLSTCLFHYGVVILGAVVGYALSVLLIQEFKIANQFVCLVLNIGFSLLGSILIAYFERPFVLFFTTGFGAFSLVFGVDLVVNRGIAYDLVKGASPTAASYVEYAVVVLLLVYGLRRQTIRHTGKFGEHRYPPRELSKENPRDLSKENPRDLSKERV